MTCCRLRDPSGWKQTDADDCFGDELHHCAWSSLTAVVLCWILCSGFCSKWPVNVGSEEWNVPVVVFICERWNSSSAISLWLVWHVMDGDMMVSSQLAHLKVVNYKYEVIRLVGEGENDWVVFSCTSQKRNNDLLMQGFGSYRKSQQFLTCWCWQFWVKFLLNVVCMNRLYSTCEGYELLQSMFVSFAHCD